MMLTAPILLLCWATLGFSEFPSFQSGTSYQYDYTLDLQVANFARPSVPRTWVVVHATVETYLLWRNKVQPEEQLVHVQIKNVVLQNKSKETPDRKEESTAQHNVETNSKLMSPILFHWSSGKVLGLYNTGDGDSNIMDLKRGLVSLFQFQPHSGFHLEEDLSGRCQVLYNVSENIISKKKILNSCIKPSFGYKSDHEILGVSWNSSSTAYMSLNGTTLQKAVCEEIHNLSANLKSFLGTHIASRQELELRSFEPGPPEVFGESVEEILGKLPEKYVKVQLQSQPPRQSTDTSMMKKYLADSKRKVKKLTISKISIVKYFNTVVKTLRQAKKIDILHLLRTSSSSNLLPFFIDAAVAAQSPASIEALSNFLDFTKNKQSKLHERFLYAAAFAPHPTTGLLRLVLEKLNGNVSDPVIMETGIIIAGAITGKLCRMDLCEEKDVKMAKATLVEGLNNAEDEAEMKTFLLSLKNAQLPETLPVLLQYAEEHTGVVCSTALSALQGFPPEFLSTEAVKDKMKSIFNQTRREYDKKSRLMAAETLLSADCSLEDLKSISAGLQLMDIESATLLRSKMQKKLSLLHPLKKPIKIHSKDVSHNYYNWSHTGHSTVFSGLLTATDDVASHYNLDLLFTESGLPRRSGCDFTVFDNSHHFKTMQVTVDAQGLDSLIGDEGDEDEGEDASVGMSAVLFGVQLRPVVFFKGYMDLISKVFSGSGEPTSVIEGNVLLIDYLQWLPMQSGLQAIVQYQAGLGLEILANVDVSLWDQQSRTNINTKAGLVLEFKTEVATSFFHVDRKTQVEAESSVHFDSTMKFSTTVLMCLEMRQDDLPYRELYKSTESFPETNATHTVQKGRKSIMWGRDFPFHPANSAMCRALKAEEDLFTNL